MKYHRNASQIHLSLSPLSMPPPSVHVWEGCVLFLFLRQGLSLNLKLAGSARLAGQQTPRIHLSLPPNTEMASPGGHAWLLPLLLTQVHLSSLASMTVSSLLFLSFSFFSPVFPKDLDYFLSTCEVYEMITVNAMHQARSKIPYRSLERISQVVCL